MTKTWENVEEGEHDDDFICMNGNACDHPWCPEHGDPEDDYASDDVEEWVRDLWRLTGNVSDDHFECHRYDCG
jgi:hypothetical protein